MKSTGGSIVVEFKRSLLQSLVLDLSFVSLAEDYEGFDQWVYSTRAAMANDLRQDIDRLLISTFGNKLLLHLAHTAPDSIDNVPGIIRWLGTIDAEWIHDCNVSTLRKLATYAKSNIPEISRDLLDDEVKLRRVLENLQKASIIPDFDLGPLVAALRNAEEMKAQIVYVLTRFWDRHAESEYARCAPLETRSVEHFQRSTFSGTAKAIFADVTGRDYPLEHVPETNQTNRMIFVPSCHCGPYVSVLDLEKDGSTLVISYNCRPTAGIEHQTGLPIEEVFPPLKALSDESRLQILSIVSSQELYAQQIVDRMNLSQSAVSRHLRLMVACGVLRERKHEGMKFYTVNDEILGGLIRHLESLRSTSE